MKPQNHLSSFDSYTRCWRHFLVMFCLLLFHGVCLAKSTAPVFKTRLEPVNSCCYMGSLNYVYTFHRFQEQTDNTTLQEQGFLSPEVLKKNKALVVAILSVLCAFTLLIIVLIRSKIQSKNLRIKTRRIALKLNENKKYIDQLLKEKELAELGLEMKEKELTTNSMSLLQKREHYNALISNLNMLRAYIKDSEGNKLLNAMISECKSSDLSFNWSAFVTTFENVHEHFYTNLLEKHPDLTLNEKKICAFLKLGFNTKEISAITMRSNRSIVVARSRLRAKLNLDSTVNLAHYIDRF